MSIRIDGHTSNDLISIKKYEVPKTENNDEEEKKEPAEPALTETILADAGSMKSGKNLIMSIPVGAKAIIEFPVRP